MSVLRVGQKRSELLADLAEMYYNQGLTQNQIAKKIGIDRSMVSRLLAEARRQGIVEIRITRSFSFHHQLGAQLAEQFGLQQACVLINRDEDYNILLQRLGMAGAGLLEQFLAPKMVLGLSWGTAVGALVEAVEVEQPIEMKIVQLVGAMGALNSSYDGHGLVQRLAQKLGCEGYFLNAPFIVENSQIAQALMQNQNVQEALGLARQCNVAVMGIGSTQPQFSSFYQAGYVPLDELAELRASGLVGDVCGHHFNLQGETPDIEFQHRTVTIPAQDLKAIPVRIGVAGGAGKAETILGAMRAGFVNILVTDENAARSVLALTGN